jgi:hypothetical protein
VHPQNTGVLWLLIRNGEALNQIPRVWGLEAAIIGHAPQWFLNSQSGLTLSDVMKDGTHGLQILTFLKVWSILSRTCVRCPVFRFHPDPLNQKHWSGFYIWQPWGQTCDAGLCETPGSSHLFYQSMTPYKGNLWVSVSTSYEFLSSLCLFFYLWLFYFCFCSFCGIKDLIQGFILAEQTALSLEPHLQPFSFSLFFKIELLPGPALDLSPPTSVFK